MLNLEFFHIQSFEYESSAHIQSPPKYFIFIISFNIMANFFFYLVLSCPEHIFMLHCLTRQQFEKSCLMMSLKNAFQTMSFHNNRSFHSSYGLTAQPLTFLLF